MQLYWNSRRIKGGTDCNDRLLGIRIRTKSQYRHLINYEIDYNQPTTLFSNPINDFFLQRCNLKCFTVYHTRQIQLRNSRLLLLDITSLSLRLKITWNGFYRQEKSRLGPVLYVLTYFQETVVFTNSIVFKHFKVRKTSNHPRKYCIFRLGHS